MVEDIIANEQVKLVYQEKIEQERNNPSYLNQTLKSNIDINASYRSANESLINNGLVKSRKKNGGIDLDISLLGFSLLNWRRSLDWFQ